MLVAAIGAPGPIGPRIGVAVLILVVVGWWTVRPAADPWYIVAVEAVTITMGCLVLPTPEPMLGLLFGVTTRRAVRDQLGPRMVRAAPAFLGYLLGALTALLGGNAAAAGPDRLGPSLVPLLGLIIGTLALGDTIAAIRSARAAEQTAVAAHERLTAILRAAPVAMVMLDLHGTVTMANDQARELFGWTGLGREYVPCSHQEDIARCEQGCLDAAYRNKSTEWTYARPDGTARTLAVHASAFADQTTSGTLLAISDITVRKDLEDRLRERAELDLLTGVASRGHFTDLLQAALDQRVDQRPALLLIDLDDFKQINDAYGHPVGDQFLLAVARQVEEAVRPAGTVGRLGGDEFAILVRSHDEAETGKLGQRVLDALATMGPVAGRDVVIHASMGIAAAETDQSAAVLLRDADTAMYEAKKAGGNRIRLFRRQMRTALLERQQEEADLRVALAEDQLALHYQPIVDASTGAIISAEALLRWNHPERGLLPPGPVVELAEQTGLIVPLGEWVLDTACRQAVQWAAQGIAIGMSVNVSARQLHLPGFVHTLTRTLANTGLPAGRLTLELTESALAKETALDVLGEVRSLGVQVALDDFGTGYSSLSYLQRHPFDLIKIDRSFISRLGKEPTAEGIIECVLQLASVLETPVVGEGVETTAQARFLASAGCTMAQGYYFGKPVPPEDWLPHMTAHQVD